LHPESTLRLIDSTDRENDPWAAFIDTCSAIFSGCETDKLRSERAFDL
jgi:hypothetical protein